MDGIRSGLIGVATVGSADTHYRPELARDFVLCFAEDSGGNLWFGTEANGLHCWRPKSISSVGVLDGMANENTWTLCPDGNQAVWVGSDGGISRIEPGRVTNFGEAHGLGRKEVRSVAEPLGTLWAGTIERTVFISRGEVPDQFSGEWVEGKVRTIILDARREPVGSARPWACIAFITMSTRNSPRPMGLRIMTCAPCSKITNGLLDRNSERRPAKISEWSIHGFR